MKSLIKKICIIISIVSLVGCTNKSIDTITLSPKGVTNIEYEELCSYLDDSYTFLLYIGRDDCSDCIEFKPYLEAYLDSHKDTGIYYLNIKEYRDASRKENATKEEKAFFKNLYKELEFDWTPTIETIQNGEIISSYQYLSESYYEIEDETKREEKKQKYLKDFNTYMDQYFESYQ